METEPTMLFEAGGKNTPVRVARVILRSVERTQNTEGDADWRDEGKCVGVNPDLFYPRRGESSRPAKEVCGECGVKDVCLQYAIDHDEKFGVWGGLSEHERRSIRRAREQLTA